MREREIFGKKIKIDGRQVRIRREKREDDKSITYKRGKILYYKSHPEAEPEILAINGYAIWYYHEFVADIEVEGKRHRVFYNPYVKGFFINEIIEADDKRILLKNPAYDEDKTKRILEIFNDGKTPDNQLRITASMIAKGLKSIADCRLDKPKVEPQPKGRPSEQYLRDATFWAISNRKFKETKLQVAARAYSLFQKDATSEESLRKSIVRKWNETYESWKAEKEKADLKKRFTFKKFAKIHLKISQKTDK